MLSTDIFCSYHFDLLAQYGLEEGERNSPALLAIRSTLEQHTKQFSPTTVNSPTPEEIKEALADIEYNGEDIPLMMEPTPDPKVKRKVLEPVEIQPTFSFDMQPTKAKKRTISGFTIKGSFFKKTFT